MKDNIKGKWLKVWTTDSLHPTYLIVADSSNDYGITGKFITINFFDGKVFSKSKHTGFFRWSRIKKTEIM